MSTHRLAQINRLVLIVAGMITASAAGTYLYLGKAAALRKARGTEAQRVTKLANDADQEARQKCHVFAFADAMRLLDAAHAAVADSTALDEFDRSGLQSLLDAARREAQSEQQTFDQKTKAGWTLIDGRMVSPEEKARALAEARQRKEAEEARLEAEAIARQKAFEEKAERERQAIAADEQRQRQAKALKEQQDREAQQQAEAREKLAEAMQTLPAIETVLGADQFKRQRVAWLMLVAENDLAAIRNDKNPDLSQTCMPKVLALNRIQAANPKDAPLIVTYREDVLDLVASLPWDSFLSANEDLKIPPDPDFIPVRFATFKGKPAILIGAMRSDTIYNSINAYGNTEKKRAAKFIAGEVIPGILKAKMETRLRDLKAEYVGLIFVYGSKNFLKESDLALPEELCIVMPTAAYRQFAQRQISQEALVRGSVVYLAANSPEFVQVEIDLE